MKFLEFLDLQMETPTLFSWFHILWLCLMIASCVLIYVFRKKISKRGVNITLLVMGIVIILLEVYKQINFSYTINPNGGGITWDYQWYAFPFQFCSTPMYLMLIAGILRKGKVYDCILSYLSTFALFAGLVVMCYPGNVYVGTIGINIQTMVCHAGMFVIGFLLLATKTVKINWATFLKGFIVFAIMSIAAMLMNVLWHFVGNEESFNMFYISPWFECALPLLDIIQANTPYVVFLLVYFVGFALAAAVMLGVARGFELLEPKEKEEDVTAKIINIIKSDL